MKVKFLLVAILVAAGLSYSVAASAGEAQIKYRQTVMKANGATIGAMFQILKAKAGDSKNLVHHANVMVEQAKVVRTVFPKDSSMAAGKTRALDAIWQKPDEFAKGLDVFEAEAAKLAEVAKSGDMAAFGAQAGALGKNACGGCHKSFREKKK